MKNKNINEAGSGAAVGSSAVLGISIVMLVVILWLGASIVMWLAWNAELGTTEPHTLVYEMSWPYRLLKWLWWMISKNVA